MNRVDIETKLNEGRNWLLSKFRGLSDEAMRRPLTTSEHNPESKWTALDHLAHLALVEQNFNAMVRRHVAGHTNPVGFMLDAAGRPRSREEIMSEVHADTERWQQAHRDDSFMEVVALTATARGETLQLIAQLSDAQLEEILPTAPWTDGTIGGVLGVNADHGRMHRRWLKEAGLVDTSE